MERSAWGLLWVFFAAPWLTWVAFHPLADLRLAWTLVAHSREASAAVMEALHNAYDVPPFSYMFDGVRVVEKTRNGQHAVPSCDQPPGGSLLLGRAGMHVLNKGEPKGKGH